MLANSFASPRMTVEEYLRFEEQSEERHEYYDGEVVDMAGTTFNHNILVDSVKDLLKPHIRGQGCQIFSENIKVASSESSFTYPDIVVTCHPFDLRGGGLIVRAPRLIVEILSKSTASKDRGIKWRQYRKMPSLWYYVLVEQYTMAVDVFSRIEQTDVWAQETFELPDEIVVFPRLNLEIRLGAIYDGIELLPEDAPDSMNELTNDLISECK
jgi:Uma2 family endonuclease